MFEPRLAETASAVSQRLEAAMAGFGDLPVAEAMRYATAGGKRMRAYLVLESAAMFGVPRDQALTAAAAVECLHAYSLVHDDLPAMDDDDLRRGLPTVHVKWDEATAILAGDALQTLAFELLASPECHPDPAVRVALIASLAKASGVAGMVGGQALDIAAETAATPLSLDEITVLQAGKTGALIRWSATAGALLAGEDPQALDDYAAALGLAFQIADDILDVTSDADTAGKRTQKDAEAGKATFVSLLGLNGAQERAEALVTKAETALAGYGSRAESLRQAARFAISRKN